MNKICSIALKHGIGHNYQYARVVATAAITMLKEKNGYEGCHDAFRFDIVASCKNISWNSLDFQWQC